VSRLAFEGIVVAGEAQNVATASRLMNTFVESLLFIFILFKNYPSLNEGIKVRKIVIGWWGLGKFLANLYIIAKI
jgi:hypothetical protein